ncbi:MAG: hypothetical protein AAGG75_11795 [Bacteroidota bacterium]
MIHPVRTILSIRLRQLYRIGKDVGWVLLLLLCPVLLIFGLRLLEIVRDSNRPEVGIGFLLLLISIHYTRKDLALLLQIDLDYRRLFAVEYSLGLLPFSLIMLIVVSDWKNPLLLQLGAPLVALLPRRIQQSNRQKSARLLRYLPRAAFEWRIGLGRLWLPLGTVYIAGLLLAHFVATVPLIILIFAYTATTFYEHLENKNLLESIHFRYGLLNYKIRSQLLIFHGLLLPHYLLFLFYHLEYWYVLPAALSLVQLLLWMVLFYKYANYAPGRLRVQNSVAVTIFSVCLFNPLMPFLFPGIVIYLYIYWKRARKNIRLYYAAH